nr:glutathione S transferase-E6 [Glyphodes pyloalis]
MSLVLYTSKVSPPSRAVMMLIEILGLDITYKEVSLPRREHLTLEYRSKNPLHTIPMLEDSGFIIVDSHAIMPYLVSKYTEGSTLYPKDLKARSLVDQRLYFDATILFPRLRSVIYSLAYGKTAGVTDEQSKDIIDAYDFMEQYLQETKYIAGNILTVADLSCVATLSSLRYVVPISDKYVKIKEWWSKLQGEQWYLSRNYPGATEFGVFMSSLLARQQ